MTNTEHAPRPYVRGTKTAKKSTARLVPGDQILATIHTLRGPNGQPLTDAQGQAVHVVSPAWTKTDAVVLTVTSRIPFKVGRPYGRGGAVTAHRIFYSGTDVHTPQMTGVQTWMIVADQA